MFLEVERNIIHKTIIFSFAYGFQCAKILHNYKTHTENKKNVVFVLISTVLALSKVNYNAVTKKLNMKAQQNKFCNIEAK